MFGKKDNPFIFSIINNRKEALGDNYKKVFCAEEIIPMIEAFFNKAMQLKVNWDEAGVYSHIMAISEIVKHLAMNTRNYEKLSDEDVVSLKKIFEEVDKLYAEAIQYKKYDVKFGEKISCISEMLCKNMVGMHDSKESHEDYRDGMIFQNYEDLWKVIHRVNDEWEELRKRGFSLQVFYDYWEDLKYAISIGQHKTKNEKLEIFMAVLDGKKKFVPIYEYRPIGFKIVDNDFEGEIVNTIENKYSNSYRMRQKGEEVS